MFFPGYLSELKDKRGLIAAVFICGGVTMILEILGARLIAPYYGNSFFVWTSVIGVILISLSVGYYKGGVEADKDPTIKGFTSILSSAAIFVSLIPFGIYLGGIFSIISLKWGPIISSILGLSLPSYYLAKVTPYSIRLVVNKKEDAGRVTGSIYSLSTLGSIAGTFLTGYFLIPYLSVRLTVYLASFILLALSAFFSKQKRVLFDLAFILVVIYLQMDMFNPWAVKSADFRVIEQVDSMYSPILVYESNTSDGPYRLLRLGNLVQGGYHTATNESVYPYVKLVHLAWLANPNIKEVLVLGNGAGIGVNEIASKHPGVRIDVVDIDPAVFEVATRNFPEKESERVVFHVDDARQYVKKSNKTYDLILLDVFGSTQEVPFHLVTVEMMQEVKKHLHENGVYMSNIVSPLTGKRSIFLKSYLKTAGAVFGNNLILPVSEDKSNTVVVFSTLSKGEYDYENFVSNPLYSNETLIIESMKRYIISGYSIDYSDGILLSDDYAPTENMILD